MKKVCYIFALAFQRAAYLLLPVHIVYIALPFFDGRQECMKNRRNPDEEKETDVTLVFQKFL